MTTPNQLIIMADEFMMRALGCAEHGIVKTPNLDKLAARGVHFIKAYTPDLICVPARAAFQTGRYVHQIRRWSNAEPYTGQPESWGHWLRAAGHRVVSIGKLHFRSSGDDNGDWKHVHYEGYETSQLFDLMRDPQEKNDLGEDPDFANHRAEGARRLNAIIDPAVVNAQAFSDQDALIATYGGVEGIRNNTALHYDHTPISKEAS